MEEISYTTAKQEIESIVESIESGKLNVDELNQKVKRASELISFCKDKLTKTDTELQKILEEIG